MNTKDNALAKSIWIALGVPVLMWVLYNAILSGDDDGMALMLFIGICFTSMMPWGNAVTYLIFYGPRPYKVMGGVLLIGFFYVTVQIVSTMIPQVYGQNEPSETRTRIYIPIK